MRKRTCTCSLIFVLNGDRVKVKNSCDKKCSGAAKNVELGGVGMNLNVVSFAVRRARARSRRQQLGLVRNHNPSGKVIFVFQLEQPPCLLVGQGQGCRPSPPCLGQDLDSQGPACQRGLGAPDQECPQQALEAQECPRCHQPDLDPACLEEDMESALLDS